MIDKLNSKMGLVVFLFAILFNTSTAKTITGSYANTHEVSVFDGYDWVETEVTDSLILTELANDSLQFEFYLIHTNGHSCSMGGVAANVDSAFEYIEILDEDDQSSECKLHIIVNDSEIILKDIDNGCRLWYCGMRGYINGIIFRRN